MSDPILGKQIYVVLAAASWDGVWREGWWYEQLALEAWKAAEAWEKVAKEEHKKKNE